MTTVSVVIPTLNEEDALPRLLEDLVAQSERPDEVILVDGASDDATRDVFAAYVGRHPAIRWRMVEGPRDVGTQRNLGARHADGDLLCFIDADTRLPPSFIATARAHADGSPDALWCPRFRPESPRLRYRLLYALFNALFWLSTFWSKPSGGGMCIVARRRVLEAHRFPEREHFEDLRFITEAGRALGYGILPATATVSVRRYEHDGYLATLGTYASLSLRFVLGRDLAAVPYDFALREGDAPPRLAPAARPSQA